MKLFEIESEIRQLETAMEDWAAEHDGDITDFPYLDHLSGMAVERSRKLLSLACWLKERRAETKAAKEVAKAATDRAKAMEKRDDGLEDFIQRNLELGEKMKDDRAEITWRKSSAVQVDIEAENLPEPYRVTKTEYSADKKALKEAIESGLEVDGVKIVNRLNLQIK